MDYDKKTIRDKAEVHRLYRVDNPKNPISAVPHVHCHIKEFEDKFYSENPKYESHKLRRRLMSSEHTILADRLKLYPYQPTCPCPCGLLKPCGHACVQSCGHSYICTNYRCMTQLYANCKVCGHPIKYFCHEKVPGPCKRICGKPCGRCGRKCQERCHAGPCKCTYICNKPLKCGHKCSISCFEHSKAIENGTPLKCKCNAPCEFKCPHSSCSRKCADPCTRCVERCVNACKHRSCSNLCSNPCSVSGCDFSCDKKLPCGCACRGLCGEACPPCPIHEAEAYKKARSFELGEEFISDILRKDPKRRVYYFKECEKVNRRSGLIDKYGHIMLVDEADKMMKAKYDRMTEKGVICPFTCPCCSRTPLYCSWRYERFWRSFWNLWNASKDHH
ncbi:hypothetical protein ADUPG1_011977 [Aduncisulcus paluster]|uniref:NF-X1-type zinc finger protein NFXL1 n=1 Tax=Aduncisulcus paluster TaxID=2918883 RepID=A0ABQ5K045_9EUKA|nr:hypothetical protein ADUPG1_011977 [Aduncisulcus paluster]